MPISRSGGGFGPPAASSLPAWLSGAAVNQWVEISGTTAPSELADFCGVAVRDDATGVEVCSAVAGGHGGNLTNNRVMTLPLHDDAPAWVQRKAASDSTGWDQAGNVTAYFPSDGAPTPRHIYTDAFWSPEQGAYLFGGAFWGSSAFNWTVRDKFTPSGASGGSWAAAGTLANQPGTSKILSARNSSTGEIYRFAGEGYGDSDHYKYNPATDSFSSWTLTGAAEVNMGGGAFSASRGIVYQLSAGNWFTSADKIISTSVDVSTGAKTAIAFNSSSAWTNLQADDANMVGNGLAYSPDTDKFYFYNGNNGNGTLSGQGARVYVVTPNGTATWDIATLSVTGVTPADEPNDSGVYSKFFYVPRWKCLVLVVSGQSVYVMRVA